jgi:predicted nuclease of predicted toxin-antitoxin system
MKLLFDESLSPKLVTLLRDLFPESESAKRVCGAGDRRILDHAASHNFILVSTDSDFERLLRHIPTANVVILRSCDYPTDVRPTCSGATRFVSLSCQVPRIA